MRDHTHTHPAEGLRSGRTSTAARDSSEVPLANHELRRGAKGLVTSRGRVLLIKERRSDGTSFWSLPGGGIERGESTQQCLRREITEELRCETSVGSVLDSCIYCHTNRPVATVYTVYEVTLRTAPEPNPAEGIVDHAWRKPTDLPTTTLTPIANVVANAAPRE